MFRLDQASLPTGALDVSRTDGLATGAPITVTYAGTGTFRARLLWTPPEDTTALASMAATSPGVWQFTPTAGTYGSYLVEGIENEGRRTERRVRRVFGVRTPNGLLIPAYGESADMLANLQNASATHVSRSTNNAVDFPNSTLNQIPWAGWFRPWHELFERVDDLLAAVGTTITQVHAPVDAVLNSAPSPSGIGYAIPSADAADGVTLITGQRCLAPFGLADSFGTTYYFWRHNGSVLVPASDTVVATGHYVWSQGGRIFANKRFDFHAASPARPWQAQGGPDYGACVSLAAGTAGEVTLPITWDGADTTDQIVDIAIIAYWHNLTTHARRTFAVSGTYYGNNFSSGHGPCSPLGEAIKFNSDAETVADCRLRLLLNSGTNRFSITALRDASPGATYVYRVEVSSQIRRVY